MPFPSGTLLHSQHILLSLYTFKNNEKHVQIFDPISAPTEKEALQILILLPGAAVCPIIDRVSFTRVVY
jgi:hypothetical protein